MAESGQLEEHNWAVFDETKTTDGNDDWSHSNHTPGECDVSNDEWQDFSSTRELVSYHSNSFDGRKQPMKGPGDAIVTDHNSSSLTDTVTEVLKDCFPTSQSHDNRQQPCLLNTKDKRLLSDLQTTVISFTSFDWSHCLIKDQFLLALIAIEQETKDERKVLDEEDLSGFDEFDWSLPDQSTTERQESVESDSDRVRFSPEDEFQGLFRPPCSRIDSPIELEFDHDKAVLGLSMLPESDLTTMRNEMSDKITKLSNELVSLLQNRDSLHLGTVAKNRFIQAMLRVQESKHAMQNTTTLSGSLGDTGTESREQESDDARYRRRSRSRSLQHFSRSIIARAKNLRTVEEDKATSDMLLRVVIPYKHNTLGSWSVPLLKKWTKILLAMAEKNPNITGLVSEYLTSVIESETNTEVKSETNTEVKSKTNAANTD